MRRLSIGDILGTSLRALGSRWPTLLVIAIVCSAPSILLDWLLMLWRADAMSGLDFGGYGGYVDPLYGDSYDYDYDYGTSVSDEEVFRIEVLVLGASSLGRVFAIAATQAVMLLGILEFLSNRPQDVIGSISKGLMRLPAALGGIVLVSTTVLFSSTCFVLPAFILAGLFFLTVPATVAEGLGPFNAIGRSVEITRGNRFLMLGIVLFVVLGFGALGFVADLALDDSPWMPISAEEATVSIPAFAVSSVLGVLQALVVAVVSCVMYARIRADQGVNAEELVAIFA